jgi:hypothetical protein
MLIVDFIHDATIHLILMCLNIFFSAAYKVNWYRKVRMDIPDIEADVIARLPPLKV